LQNRTPSSASNGVDGPGAIDKAQITERVKEV
jgi:hypothetical protein